MLCSVYSPAGANERGPIFISEHERPLHKLRHVALSACNAVCLQ